MNKVKKTIKLISTNKDDIRQILVSEDFMLKLAQYPSEIQIESRIVNINREDNVEIFFLFGVPMTYSNILKLGAVLVMKDGENIILKNM